MHIVVSAARQQLTLIDQGDVIFNAPVSTGKAGMGEDVNSDKTPRGWHYIRAKIGADAAINSVFVGRRLTGEIYTPKLSKAAPDRDWILTRILWLCGKEIGKNRLGRVDTMRRYVYIHGTPDCYPMGVPLSHGCIRMQNEKLITLFDLVPVYTPVLIEEF